MQVYTFITEHFIAFEVDSCSVVYCDCPRTLSWFTVYLIGYHGDE